MAPSSMPATVAALVLALFSESASAGLRHTRMNNTGAISSTDAGYRLRICNAYPNAAAMDVYLDKANKLSGNEPLAYQTCREFLAPLTPGTRIEFKVGDTSAGSFSVADLPNNDAVLLLVIHRHDTVSTAVSFESHVFANLLNAQVAVIDTYKGKQKATVRIFDGEAEEKGSRSEHLRFNSVVAVNPGRYQVELLGANHGVTAKGELVAVNHESYVVMRAGVEAQEGSSPPALMIFPKSDPALLKGAATRDLTTSSLLFAVMALTAAFAADAL